MKILRSRLQHSPHPPPPKKKEAEKSTESLEIFWGLRNNDWNLGLMKQPGRMGLRSW